MAKAILSRPTDSAAKPVTPSPKQRLTSELDAAHLAMERLYNVIHVAVTALSAQGADIDSGIAVCLENAVEVELNPAKDRIVDALALAQEVPHG